MAKNSARHFRIGKVQGYLRSKVWYLDYHEHGKRHRPRIGPDREAARRLASEINAQLFSGAPTTLSFEVIPIPDLRQQWLDHHELVLRSSVQTIARYRTATDHLLRFLEIRPVKHISHFHNSHAAAFVHYLRDLEVSPNGHRNTKKRPLKDTGLRFILETCRAMFNFAIKRRHMSPYAENPFSALEIDRIPVEDASPIHLFDREQEQAFLEACDEWQFPIFLTLMLTGIRLGELTHLMLPGDIDLEARTLYIRNKPELGWRVKTRNEREIPLLPCLANVLRYAIGGRRTGLVFRRRFPRQPQDERFFGEADQTEMQLAMEQRIQQFQIKNGKVSRQNRLRIAQTLWRENGVIREERIRLEFIRLTQRIGVPHSTAPKVLRHMFATYLQEGRVDPLIRNELMGHVSAGKRMAGHGLAMTAVYTHTRPETRRQQLEEALSQSVAVVVAQEWLRNQHDSKV